MNPWDRFAARMFGTGDIITNSAGDTLIHDEIVVRLGDIRHEAVTAVMCHAHNRFIDRWGPLINRAPKIARLHNRPLVKPGFLQRYAPHSRYNKWEV